MPKTKGLDLLNEVIKLTLNQIKLATKRSKKYFHMSHASGSGDGVETRLSNNKRSLVQMKELVSDQRFLMYPDLSRRVMKNLGHLVKMRMMLFHMSHASGSGDGVETRLSNNKRSLVQMKELVSDQSEETKSDNDGDDLTHHNLSTYKADDERVSTPHEYELTEEEENKEGDDEDMEGEQEQDEEDDLYRDMNINLERSDAEMTNAQANQDTKDTHVALTTIPPIVQQQSSSISSYLVSKFINPSPDAGSITTITIQTMTLPDIPNSASLFQFDQWVSTLETEMFEFRQTSQFVEAISSILGIVDNFLASKMKKAVDVAVQL
nr:hypothetical protein [Tanacetum cinerariifolium]